MGSRQKILMDWGRMGGSVGVVLQFIINQMRLISRSCYSLQTWNVSTYIKEVQANIIKQDNNRFITMQNIIKKLYLRHLKDHELVQNHIHKLNELALMGESPARSIADYFHQKAKVYSQDFMRATFQYLGKAYDVSRSDNGGSLDTLGYKLFLSAEFGNLSEQFKFALKNNKVSFSNLVSIVESLIKIEYVDYQILNLLLLYTEREIKCTDEYAPLDGWKGDRQFQIEKKNYYNPDDEAILAGLRSSSEVNTAISFVKHIYEQWQQSQRQIADLKEAKIEELSQLINSISQTNVNFRKIVEGIITIRREYVKMVQLSSNDQILRNPNLNMDLLALEQKLLALKLLNIDDLRKIGEMKNAAYEVKRVEEILVLYLNVDNLNPILSYIHKKSVEVKDLEEKKLPDPSKISILFNLISKLASLDRFVYHTTDGRSLINLRWEKTLIEQHSGSYIPGGTLREELNVARIFRRVYSQTLTFFKNYQSEIEQIFKSTSAVNKILLFDSWCRLGLHEKAIVAASQFQVNGLAQEVSGLPVSSFMSLIHLLNDIGIFIANRSLHQQVFVCLKSNLDLQEFNKSRFWIRFNIDVLNYLIQNHKNNEGFDDVYDRYLGLLEAKVTYLVPEENQNELLVEAFKILALEKPERYGSHPVYLNFIHQFVNGNLKKNPYHQILRETCYKWSRKETLLKQMQTHLNLGVTDGALNGLVFSNSDQTSLDGEIRSGDLNSYIIRLSVKNNMLMHQFSVNSFLDIDYSNKNQVFKLKSVNLLEQRLDDIFQRQMKPYEKKYEQQEELIIRFLQVYPDCLISKKIKFKLSMIRKIRNNGVTIQTKQQQLTNKALFFLEVLELNKLIRLLEEEDILKEIPNVEKEETALNTRLGPNFKEKYRQQMVKVDLSGNKALLREIKFKFKELIEMIANGMKQEMPVIEQEDSSIKLKGQRQSIDTLAAQSSGEVVDFSVEFINSRYFNDKSFCEYKDWRDQIKQVYNMVQISTEKVSNLSKILINRFCPELTDKVTLLPMIKHSKRLRRLNLQFKLLKDNFVNVPEKRVDNLTVAESKQLQYKINLQNFKHELKTTFNSKTILDFIFGFKFVLDIKSNNPDPSKMLLHRDPEAYFNYLEDLNERKYIQSPYIHYILSKLSKTDKIRRLLEKRKDARIIERSRYQKGEISAETYYQRINLIEDEIIQAAEQLKTKMLGHMQDSALSGELKMWDIRKEEIQAFEQMIRKSFNYNRHFDLDFISANGNYERAINLKRGRAQSNYIKLYLLKRLTESKGLNDRQANMLQNWHEDIIKGVTQLISYDRYTTMLISELPWQDLQSLRLKSSSLNSNKDMLVIDFIMELNLFLNDSLIESYERRVKAEYISKNYHIPLFMFDQSTSAGLRQIENQVEKALIGEYSKLKQEDLDTMEGLFKIFKTEGLKERRRYQELCRDFKEKIAEMNEDPIREELIQEYVKVMEDEFMKEYDPALVEEIKDKQTDKLWREIFHHPYDNCNKEQLKNITRQLILRIELLKGKTLPFFGNLIINLLQHPNLDSLTKESLIASIELNKIDLKLDSTDIKMLAGLKGKPDGQSVSLKRQFAFLNENKMGEMLYGRAKALL